MHCTSFFVFLMSQSTIVPSCQVGSSRQEASGNVENTVPLFFLFFMSQSTIFPSCQVGSSWVELVLKLGPQGQNIVPTVRLETHSPSISSQALYH